jgi:hypothetical protein
MATYYVDINNSYVTTGDGSSGSPYNLTQMLAIRIMSIHKIELRILILRTIST